MTVTDDAEDAVRAQYERWVYPKPIHDLSTSAVRDLSDPALMGRAYWPNRPPREDLRILIAGCGPNTAARYAYHHPKAKVVGVDISESSLAHESNLKSKHNLNNLTLHRCPIEDIASLGQSFDFIECSGVIHHLADPAAGLSALARVLSEDGVVFVMLYGRYGRTGIYMMQDLFRILGLRQSSEDVALARTALATLRPEHPLHSCRVSPDDLAFDGGIVDMFLHPRDRAYTAAECLDLLDSSGLILQDWMDRHVYDLASQIPPGNLRDCIGRLPPREALSAIELFDGRITMHAFYACRRDRNPSHYRVDFDGTAFMDMVPVARQGWVQDMSGNNVYVLKSDTGSPEIRLDQPRAAVVAQIDGNRSVRDCFHHAGGKAESAALVDFFCRGLFRQLWLAGYCDLVYPSWSA